MVARQRAEVDTVTVITWNLKDFNRQELWAAGLEVENPDTFLCRLLADTPDAVETAFVQMRDNLKNPPKTTVECADTLDAQGLTAFASQIKTRLENR